MPTSHTIQVCFTFTSSDLLSLWLPLEAYTPLPLGKDARYDLAFPKHLPACDEWYWYPLLGVRCPYRTPNSEDSYLLGYEVREGGLGGTSFSILPKHMEINDVLIVYWNLESLKKPKCYLCTHSPFCQLLLSAIHAFSPCRIPPSLLIFLKVY